LRKALAFSNDRVNSGKQTVFIDMIFEVCLSLSLPSKKEFSTDMKKIKKQSDFI
jgi:hypothetical protein